MSDEPDDSVILERIAKCLELSKCAEKGEAAAALAAAQRLMEKYNISAERIKIADIKESRIESKVIKNPSLWEAMLTSVISNAFHCTSIFFTHGYTRGEWGFIGRKDASEVAAYAFSVLYRSLLRARRKHVSTLTRCSMRTKVKRGDVFCMAWVEAIRKKVGKFSGNDADRKLLDTFMEDKYSPGDLSPSNRLSGGIGQNDRRSYFEGLQAGNTVELYHGVPGYGSTDKQIESIRR